MRLTPGRARIPSWERSSDLPRAQKLAEMRLTCHLGSLEFTPRVNHDECLIFPAMLDISGYSVKPYGISEGGFQTYTERPTHREQMLLSSPSQIRLDNFLEDHAS